MKKYLRLILLFSLTTFTYAQPTINQPSDLVTCEQNINDGLHDGVNNGLSFFNLSSNTSEILNGLNPSLYSVSFFTSLLDSENGVNSIINNVNYFNIVPFLETIFVRVEEIANPDSFSLTNFNLIVQPFPEITEPSDITIYEDPFDGIAIFDITSNETIILNSLTNSSLTYYRTLNAALTDVNQINNPTSFSNTTNSETIYIRVVNNITGCFSITDFNLEVLENSFINIPDSNFKNKLLSTNSSILIALDNNGLSIQIDANNNNEIELTEALNVHELYVHFSAISNLEGIQYFTNLRGLGIKGNNLTSILDLTDLIHLELLNATDNSIDFINLDGLNNLKLLECHNNLLTTINTSSLTQLEILACIGNQITSLDLSQNINLNEIFCRENLLTNLDVSQNANLSKLSCGGNQLTSLFMKNGSIETFLDFSNNPDLAYICADENQVVNIQAQAGTDVVVNSYCSFTPGGNYNTITGNIVFDANANGCDASDLPYPNIRVDINDGTEQGAAFSNATGIYTFYTEAGSFDIMPNTEYPTWFTISPTNVTIPFADNNNNTTTQDFCIVANGIHNDVEIVIAPIAQAQPGFDVEYQITYKNKGNQIASGSIDFAFDDAVLDFVSATTNPDVQTTGNLTWNYTNLSPFESRSFQLTLNVNAPTETPAVNIDDVLDFMATIYPISGDEIPLDNVFNFNQTVVGSFDPNDKVCVEGDFIEPNKIGDYLHYIINFENTGTAAATFVVVKDIIDETKFDINTLQILNTSHEVDTKIMGNKVEFIFDAINLGATEKGHVLFKIKTLNTLVIGDDVSNKADIFFDYNFPIETNIANSVFQVLSINQFNIDNSITVFPNPVNDIVNVKANSAIKSIQVFDIQGRLIVTKLENQSEASLTISSFTSGTYFLKVKTVEGVSVEKIIK